MGAVRKCGPSWNGDRILIGTGSCLLVRTPDALVLRADATDLPALERVKDVVARHLVRFDARNELVRHVGGRRLRTSPRPPQRQSRWRGLSFGSK